MPVSMQEFPAQPAGKLFFDKPPADQRQACADSECHGYPQKRPWAKR